MKTTMRGEYDNYDYRTSDELSLEEQIDFTKRALKSAIRISQTNKDDYWNKKIVEIKQKLQELEILKMTQL